MRSLLASLAAVLMSGCATMADTPSLDHTAWVLASLPGEAAPGNATLRFEGDRALGSDGCNRFSLPFSTTGDRLRFSTGPPTRMACPPEVQRRAESFMQALGGAASYRMQQGQLQLLGTDGAVRASLAPQPQALAGTRWRAVGINNGRGGVVSVQHDTQVTLAFDADGRANGSAGCNAYTARYRSDGSAVRFEAPAATRKACTSAGVMEQELAYLGALESTVSMRREGDRLELRNAAGAVTATFAPVTPR